MIFQKNETVKGTNPKQKDGKPAKPQPMDGKPTNKSTSKSRIFQEMKQLKAQIKNKKMEILQNHT